MPVSDPPHKPPWFPDGDPLVRWGNINPIHRLIDPYETYDLLVTFRNTGKRVPTDYITRVIDNDDSENRILQHPLVPFQHQFKNTRIYCYDRLIPNQPNIASNYIIEMKKLIDKIWELSLESDGVVHPEGLFTTESNSFEFTPEEDDSGAYLTFYVRESGDFYNIGTIRLYIKKNVEFLIELPPLCPVSLIVTASENNREIIKTAIREQVGNNILYDDIKNWTERLIGDNTPVEFDDPFSDVELDLTTTIKTPIDLNKIDTQELLDNEILQTDSFLFLGTICTGQSDEPPNLPEVVEESQNDSFAVPYLKKFFVPTDFSERFLSFDSEERINEFESSQGCSVNTYSYFAGQQAGRQFLPVGSSASDCQIDRDDLAETFALEFYDPPELTFEEAKQQVLDDFGECQSSYRGYVQNYSDPEVVCLEPFVNDLGIREYTTPEEGVFKVYEREDDIESNTQSQKFSESGIEISPIELVNEVIRTNRSIFGNTFEEDYPSYNYFIDFETEEENFNQIVLSKNTLTYLRENGIDRFAQSVNRSEEIDQTSFTVIVPMPRGDEYGGIEKDSCPFGQATVDLPTIKEETGKEWSSEGIDNDVKELENDTLDEIIDKFNWEYEVDENGEVTGELVNHA